MNWQALTSFFARKNHLHSQYALQSSLEASIRDIQLLPGPQGEPGPPGTVDLVSWSVFLNSDQSIPAQTYTRIEFSDYIHSLSPVGYDVTNHQHAPGALEGGVWHYSILVETLVITLTLVRCVSNRAGEVARARNDNGRCLLAFDHLFQQPDEVVWFEVYLNDAADLHGLTSRTRLSGHLVQPVSYL